jgi:solute carrier family 8 (sodium/calcium exchanger)
MALGSSAPEILLSLMETIVGIEETPSELGPQAIVGSASFNLLVISGVSVLAVTEVKWIDAYNVFITTAVASTFAYIWFFLVLAVISPDEIEMWEAFLTFGFMIILVIIAYAFDKLHNKNIDV